MRGLLFRLLLAVGLILLTTLVMWLERDGLQDNARPGQPLGLLAVLYYTVVTLTTVGYGDIIPVSDLARWLNIVFVAPLRIIILVLFIGTAYELIFIRFQEAFRMKRLHAQLHHHTIVCGYGVKGRASVEELLSYGIDANQIVVIDMNPESIDAAAERGIAALRGDATSEATLHAAAIEKAAHVIVDVDTDDTTVLICLTVKHLNPAVQVVAAAREAENVPLIYNSGADAVVASAVASGRMLALATRQHFAPRFVEDIITFGRGMDIGERAVRPEEDGLYAGDLPDLRDKLLLGMYHDGRSYAFDQLAGLPLRSGDIIVYLAVKS
jgi:voltage-gated potassium channel